MQSSFSADCCKVNVFTLDQCEYVELIEIDSKIVHGKMCKLITFDFGLFATASLKKKQHSCSDWLYTCSLTIFLLELICTVDNQVKTSLSVNDSLLGIHRLLSL